METTIIHKECGRFSLEALETWFRNALDGNYRIEITKIRRKRTLDQNGWLFGCIYPMLLKGLNDEGWEFVSVHQVHEFFKTLMGKEQFINKHTGEVVEIPCSTAEMDTLTFSTYCDKLRDYGREYLGIEIPDPDKLWNER
mgnify:CR=1 FL=1